MEHVLIRQTHTTTHGARYEAFHNGVVIVKSSKDPEHDAARWLHANGYAGPFQTAHYLTPHTVSLTFRDIEHSAGRAVREDDQHRPYETKWSPRIDVDSVGADSTIPATTLADDPQTPAHGDTVEAE